MAVKIALVLILAIVALAAAQDIAVLLRNQNLVEKQISCVMKRSPCDFIGKQIKGLLPEALHNNCGRCTPRQAENSRKLIAFMSEKYPKEWHTIRRMYKYGHQY